MAGYRAPLPPRLARPSRSDFSRNGGGGGIRTHGTVARTRHFQCRTFGHSATPPGRPLRPRLLRFQELAEGRGFEPPRDSRPYPISSRTPSTGLGHPSANVDAHLYHPSTSSSSAALLTLAPRLTGLRWLAWLRGLWAGAKSHGDQPGHEGVAVRVPSIPGQASGVPPFLSRRPRTIVPARASRASRDEATHGRERNSGYRPAATGQAPGRGERRACCGPFSARI